jgi:choline monooxygenase
MKSFAIDPDIARARTPPGEFYRSRAWFERQRETVFATSWHMFSDPKTPQQPGELQPWNLLPGSVDEPLVLCRDHANTLRALSNVCTHRGNLLIDRPCTARSLRCQYHGRRFDLTGRCLAAPGFGESVGFPSATDHLQSASIGQWRGFVFASLAPRHSFDALVEPLDRRLSGLPFDALRFAPERSRDYHFRANWALYCDNYLEGLHIPFVHPSLRQTLDLAGYAVELLDYGVLQLGKVAIGEPGFSWPKSHPDHGSNIGAYYYWLFPTTMINVYPWGLSLNLVQPQGARQTKVAYRTYLWDDALYDRGAGSGLEQVELEDEAIVERTSQGLRAGLYDRGRYAPSHERGVHHFHRLLVDAL